MAKRKRAAKASQESPPEKKSDTLPSSSSSTAISEQKQSNKLKSPAKSSINPSSIASSSTKAPVVETLPTKISTSTTPNRKRHASDRLLREPLKKASLDPSTSKNPSSKKHKKSVENRKQDKARLSSSKSSKDPSKRSSTSKALKQQSSLSASRKQPEKEKKSNYDHLTEEEKAIIVGFTPPPKRVHSSDLPPKASNDVPKTTVQRENLCPPASPAISTPKAAVPFVSCSTVSSYTSPATPTSSSRHSSMSSSSSTLTPSSVPSSSSSSASDFSILMEVKKAGKMVFVNPFLPFSPATTTHNSSDSVILIEDSPNPQPLKKGSPICTSTPRPSMSSPAFGLFPSPISKGDKTIQETAISSPFVTNFDTSNNVTVVNKCSDGQDAQDDVIVIEDTLINCTNREEEDMDIDDELVISTMNDARDATMMLESETIGVLTETVAQKSIVEHPSNSENVHRTVLAIDTNVFISGLNSVKDVLKHPLALSRQLFVLLPWVVLQELDYLKDHNKGIGWQCRDAVRFINQQLNVDNSQFISQSPQQATEKLIPVESNDDKILICCLQRMRSYKEDRVILISRDLNLLSKALVSGIESANNETMWRKLQTTTADGKKLQPPAQPAPTRSQPKPPTQPATTRSQPQGPAPGYQPQGPAPGSQPPIQSIGRHRQVQSHTRQTLGHARVANKLSYIFDLIFFTSSEIYDQHYQDQEILRLVANVSKQADVMHNQYERCLMIAPTHLMNNHALFIGLSYTLNHFTEGYYVPIIDTTETIHVKELLRFFEDTDNRPQLYVGLQNLKEVLQTFQAVVQYL